MKNWFFSPSRPPRLVSSAIFMLCAAAKIAVLCQQKSIAIFTKKNFTWYDYEQGISVCNCNIKKSGIMHGFLDFHLLKDLIILTLLCWNISSPGLQLWKMVWKYKLIIFYTDSHIHMYKKFQKNAVKGRAPRTQELLLENAESLIKEVAKNVIPVYHLWKLIRTI